jgi:hypothetical protein
MTKIYIQSEMLKACCDAMEWDYDECLESFNYFYTGNRNKIRGGLREAIFTWYNIKKDGKSF